MMIPRLFSIAAVLVLAATVCVPGRAWAESCADILAAGEAARSPRDLDTLLSRAIAARCTDAVAVLIDLGAVLRQPRLNDVTADGAGASVRVHVDAGSLTEQGHRSGRSVLHHAAAEGQTEIVGLLLDAGADPGVPDATGDTALAAAARRGNADLVALLLDAGAAPDFADASGRTPLMFAATAGHAEVVRLLLAAGANPSNIDAAGYGSGGR